MLLCLLQFTDMSEKY